MVPAVAQRLARQHVVPLLLLVVLSAGVAAIWASERGESYRAEGRLLLSQVEANDQLGAAQPDRLDADRYVANQIEVIGSDTVADAAAEAGASVAALRSLEVTQVGQTDLVVVSVTAGSARAAETTAGAVMASYARVATDATRSSMERQVATLDRQLLELAARLADAQTRLADAELVLTERAVLEAQRDADLGTYAQLSADRQRVQARVGLAGSGAEVVQPADESEVVEGAAPAAAAAGASVAMGVLGLGGLVARERLRNRLTNRVQVEGLDLGVRVFGEIPLVAGLDDGSALPAQHRAPDGPMAGPVRLLRRAIDMTWDLKPNTTVLVTSPGRREGRTTLVANLATAYARSGVSCLVADADLRRAGLSAALDLPVQQGGMTAVLQGHVGAYEATVETGVHGLRALPAGPVAGDPVSLLGTERAMTTFVDAADDEVVFVDSPALLEAPDARLIIAAVDAVLVVVRAGHTTVRQLEDAVEVIREVTAAPIGIVLNEVVAS